MVITTIDATIGTFFARQLADLAGSTQASFAVHAVSSPGRDLEKLATPVTDTGSSSGGSITTHAIPMERQPHPLRDLVSVWKLFCLMRRIRPQIVHAHTPKAGLLGMMAAKAAGVKVRLYTIHGLPLETRQGWWRRALQQFERTTCSLATQVYSVSPSLESVVRSLKLCADAKLSTLGDGTCAGIDLLRFHPEFTGTSARVLVRRKFDIPENADVICFVGRLARDKGIEVLADAWRTLSVRYPDAHLLLCGPEDASDPVSGEILDFLRHQPTVHMTGHWIASGQGSSDISSIYAASDIFVLPTFREGLPQVAMEASAMGLPVVGTNVTGVVDAVRDGITGLLVPARDTSALTASLERLLLAPALRAVLGAAGRDYIAAHFSEERVNQLWMSEYHRLARGGCLQPTEIVAQTESARS